MARVKNISDSQGKLQIRNASLNLVTIQIKGSDLPKLRDAFLIWNAQKGIKHKTYYFPQNINSRQFLKHERVQK